MSEELNEDVYQYIGLIRSKAAGSERTLEYSDDEGLWYEWWVADCREMKFDDETLLCLKLKYL